VAPADNDVSSEEMAADYHRRLYGKPADELVYTDEVCQFCNSRIDERGWCACGTMGGG
jgi:hypothetical protein